MSNKVQRTILKTMAAIVLIVLGAVGWTTFKLWRSWNSVERVPFDLETSRVALTGPPISLEPAQTEPGEPGEIAIDAGELELPEDLVLEPPKPVPDEAHGVFLAIGTDNRPGFGGDRADVILLFMLPENGGGPALLSLPRDLYVRSPCTNRFNRINVNLNGCGGISGIEVLAIAVEDFTGLTIDHVAMFDFDGFIEVIDRVGGVEICTDYPVRDSRTWTPAGHAELRLEAGCNVTAGDQALAWVRSRNTLELVNGRWRTMPGVNDLTRNQRQQDMILQMLGKMKQFGSLGELTRTVQSLADAFTVDEGLTLSDAASLAWSVRDLDPTTIQRVALPVRNHTTTGGAQVLVPTQTFTDLLEEIYPSLVAVEAAAEE